MLNALHFAMKKNEKLGKYDLKYNNISDTGLKRLTEILAECPNVNDIEVPERVDEKEVFDAFRKQLAENKPKKGKKGGKKKKKKK